MDEQGATGTWETVAGRFRGTPVLVLGATGFIGRWVARLLCRAQADVHLAVRRREVAAREFADYGVAGTIHTMDLCEHGALRELCAAVRPCVVFNLAGYGVNPAEGDERLARRINDELPGELVRALAGCRDTGWGGFSLVHAGSAAEYGAADGDLRESTDPRPMTLYGRSKLAGTLRSMREGARASVGCVVARLFTVYGPGERDGRLLPTLVAAASAEGPIPLTDGSQRRDFTYVEDVAEGMLRLACCAGGGNQIVNLATGRLRSVREFVQTAASVLGIHEARLAFGALPRREDEMRHDPVCVARLRTLTGWTPTVEPAEGIRRTRDFSRALNV